MAGHVTYAFLAFLKSIFQLEPSLWPSDTIWWHGSGSTLALVMACCLMAPSHYLNQCWLIISEVIWLTPEGNFTGNGQNIYILRITFLRLQPYLPGTNELIIKKFYVISCYAGPCYDGPEIILDMVSANERQLYIVTLPFIGWTRAQNDPRGHKCILFDLWDMLCQSMKPFRLPAFSFLYGPQVCAGLPGVEIKVEQPSIDMTAWMSNHSYMKLWDVITHPCLNFNSRRLSH